MQNNNAYNQAPQGGMQQNVQPEHKIPEIDIDSDEIPF